ncbi:MAG: hypothetical protein NMK33_03900 [Candidatus Cardinium sp.]|uniref:hypothetical protein n=1 Tax=Cardinium endosymbiont of Dermatophagoides farinae TaxID=2597823 RepID=UPI00118274A4|nr:hypothetical protein [Cardinium endosymbiont of Dermatophagoides farinae]TSJ80587.1 hypothetical protein FPG78_00625 [Cardinium endosymbiont of Dermatophagoides farinae]UWW96575.1 MAG: hypothetical protein NMK33_03900 [Candidatus Cardinium sp.]
MKTLNKKKIDKLTNEINKINKTFIKNQSKFTEQENEFNERKEQVQKIILYWTEQERTQEQKKGEQNYWERVKELSAKLANKVLGNKDKPLSLDEIKQNKKNASAYFFQLITEQNKRKEEFEQKQKEDQKKLKKYQEELSKI